MQLMSARNSDLAVTTFVVTAFFFSSLLLIGCSATEKPTPTESRLVVVGEMYEQFRRDHRGQVPQDEAEFRQFIQDKGDYVLEQAQANSIDELFVSERDGQPLVVLYGKKAKWLDGFRLVVHEATGVNNQIMVGYMSGESELISAELFKSIK
jgi:hypothetical protein